MERVTRQNTAIRAAIEGAGRPLSPAEVLSEAQRHVAALGLATVYRNLRSLAEAGAIQVVTLPGEIARYEVAQLHHHHHFRCDECQKVYDVLQCPGDLANLAPPGFAVVRHEITLYGTCLTCQRSTRGGGSKPPRKASRAASTI